MIRKKTSPSAQSKGRDIFHFLTRLHHGVVRFRPYDSSPTSVVNAFQQMDRKFVFVPEGYLQRDEKVLDRILGMLELKQLPTSVVITAASEGTSEELLTNSFQVRNAEGHQIAKDWSKPQQQEVLQAKVQELLESTVNCCAEVGAWLIPHRPRMRNGAAQMICDALPKSGGPVALGLVGLDEQDEAEGLTARIMGGMVPIGSPAHTVTEIVHDPKQKDSTPCPQLSHLVFFQNYRDCRMFRAKILSLVPDALLAFGDLTKNAKQSVYSNAVSGSPVVLLEHTGTSVDNLSRMFRHAAQELNKLELTADDKVVKGNAKLPPLTGMVDEDVQKYISAWPTRFDFDTVVLADPLLMTSAMFQKRLFSAITAAFSLSEIRAEAVNLAQSYCDTLWQSAKEEKKSTELLHTQLIIATFAAVAASVLYAKLYGAAGLPSLQNPMQIAGYLSTILLPFYIVSLEKTRSSKDPSKPWVSLQVASAKVESEIFKFLSQVGPYRLLDHANTQHAVSMPHDIFLTNVHGIWLGAWQFVPAHKLNNIDDNSSLQIRSKEKGQADTPVIQPEEADLEAPPSETTPILPKLTVDTSDVSTLWNKRDDRIDWHSANEKCLSLTSKEYIEIRIDKHLESKSLQMKSIESRKNMIQTFIKIVTGSTTALAALSFQWVIPIVLGVSTALSSGLEFCRYDQRRDVGNNMVLELEKLKEWWTSLPVEEKRIPENQDRLVQESENLIVSELSSSFGLTAKAQNG